MCTLPVPLHYFTEERVCVPFRIQYPSHAPLLVCTLFDGREEESLVLKNSSSLGISDNARDMASASSDPSKQPAASTYAEVSGLIARHRTAAGDAASFAAEFASAPPELREAYSRVLGDHFVKSVSVGLLEAVGSGVAHVIHDVAGGVASVFSALTHSPGAGAPAGKTVTVNDASPTGFEWVDTTAVYDAISTAKPFCESSSLCIWVCPRPVFR